jgi:Na+/melibiose symporter-like transporter
LTLLGKRCYEKNCKDLIEYEQYELNPFWQDSVAKGNYGIKHFVFLIILCFAVFLLWYGGERSKQIFYFCVGFISCIFIIANFLHLQSILFFKYIGKNKNAVKGKIKYSYRASLEFASNRYFTFGMIILFIYIFAPNSFTLGASVAPLILSVKLRIDAFKSSK